MLTNLGNHITTQKGFAFRSDWYRTTGIPIVKVSDFTDDSIDTSGLTYIPEEIAKEQQRYRLITGDVVIQTVGSWPSNPKSVVGKAIKTPFEANGVLLNQNAVRLDPNEDLDKTYLFYLLRNAHFKNYIVGCAQGAASQASITLEAIRAYTFELPPFRIQRRIADILSAYDNLIENNERRVSILEKMAHANYQKRFGKVDKESLPKGWKLVNLGELIDFAKGKKPKETFPSGETPLLLIESIQKGITEFTNDSTLVIAETDDVIMVMDGASSGKVFLGQYGAVGSTLGRYRTKDKESFSHYHFYFFILANSKQITDNNIGSAIPHANKDFINQMKVCLPPPETEKLFHDQMRPILDLVGILQKKNANLRRTRDLVLPHLINGDIETSIFS